jgi:methylamine dehydrogenase accessory protein MauD
VSLLVLSNVVLWVTVLALVLVVLALARQVGLLNERIAPMGALALDGGPAAGSVAPSFALPSLDGGEVRIGGTRDRAMLLFFLSPDCPVCKKLLPILRSLAAAERSWLDVVLASDGTEAEHRKFRERQKLGGFAYLLSGELGLAFRVAKLPYAVLIGETGIVRAKGLVNSREQLESLITAKELGHGTLQDFLAARRETAPEALKAGDSE